MKQLLKYSDFLTEKKKNKVSKEAQKFISNKIAYLMDKEDKPQKQAIAMAYSYAKREGLIDEHLSQVEAEHAEFTPKENFTRAEVIQMLEDVYAEAAGSYNDYGKHKYDYEDDAATFVATYMQTR